MKLFALAALLVSAQSFAAGCPTLIREPKTLTCQTNSNYYGSAMSKALVINLSANDRGTFSGSTDFDYPGVSNGDDSKNTIKADVWVETHGNSVCQQWNEVNVSLNLLSYSFSNVSFSTAMTTKDAFGKAALTLNMSCRLR